MWSSVAGDLEGFEWLPVIACRFQCGAVGAERDGGGEAEMPPNPVVYGKELTGNLGLILA